MKSRKSPIRLRAAAAVSAATAALVAITGCSGPATSSSSAPASNEPVKLSFAIWDQNQKDAMQQIADAFTAEHPNVTFEIQVNAFEDYWTKLQTAAAGGAGPDVFWMNGPNFQLYASNGLLAPLDDQNIDTTKYSKGLVDLYTYEGKLYGAPKDFDTIGVWYNKTLFDAAGVAYPKAGWTWDDFKATARQLTDKKKGIYGVVAAQYNQMEYYPTIYQAGGEVISADHKTSGYGSPQALEGITFWTDFIKSGDSPTAQQMTDTEPNTIFQNGKAAMLWNGSWAAGGYGSLPKFKNQVDVAPLPAGPAGNMSVVHGLAAVANAKGAHADIAKQFAAFVGSEKAAQIQASSGAVIPAYAGTQQAWMDANPQYNLQVFIDALSNAVPYPVSKNTSAWTKLEGDVLTQVWAGNVEASEGLKELATKMQAALDEEQS